MYPARELMRAGHDVEVAPHKKVPLDGGRRLLPVYGALTRDGQLITVDQALRLRPAFDLLVMQQRSEPGVAEWVSERLGFPYVVDSDDAWFRLPAYNPGSRRPQVERAAMVRQITGAAAMTVSTPALADMYSEWCEDITVIRNTLDWRMWENAPQQSEVERRRVRVGYMGDARWHAGDLKILRGVIGPWLRRNPQVEFVAAGDPQIHEILDVPREQRVSVADTQFHRGDLADITACFDIGLVPLANEHMNECKSHLKGLEYAACGIPCIATPTESYKWWATQTSSVILAKKPKDWTAALDTLVNGDVFRRAMGRWARKAASEHTIQNHWTEWEAVYARVCGVDAHAAREEVAA
jgi:glycosyltransferase involved in cell wall biosynthesis